MADEIPEFEQGTRIRVTGVFTRNPPEWSPYRTYLIDDYARWKNKIWCALATSLGVVPVEGASWAADSGRIDPDLVKFALLVPGFEEEVHTLTSDGTILVRDDTGVYFAFVDSTPAYGTYAGRWYSAGAGQAAGKWVAKVRPANIPML